MSDPNLGTAVYVPVLYSWNQLEKMRERMVIEKPVQWKKENCTQNSSVLDSTSKSTFTDVDMNNCITHIIDNDSSDDDEISVISVKIASKPSQKMVNSSFETTLMKNFSVKAKDNELQNISLNVPTTTKVNLFVPVENQNQSKFGSESNSSVSNRREFSFDNEHTSNSRSNATAKPIPVVSKQVKEIYDSPVDTLKMKICKNKQVNNGVKFGTTKFTSGNEQTVLIKQEMIENLQKDLLSIEYELEDTRKTLDKKDSEIHELRKRVDIVTTEKEMYAKTADNNEKELNKVKASFIERNLEIQNLQNKYVLLTKDYRKSEEMRRDNEKVIDNLKMTANDFKREKEDMSVIIDSLKTDLKILPGKEKLIEELQSEVIVLTERSEEFDHLKIKVLPEKENIILGLERKVTLLGETETAISEQKIVVQQLRTKLRGKQIDLDTLLEEKNKNISEKESTLQQKMTELTEKENLIQDLQQSANDLLDRANELQTKLNEKDKDMSKKEEIIEYFEAKVNEISGKEKDLEDFKKKVFTEKEKHEKEVVQLIEKSKDVELITTNLQSEKEKVCELETRIIELTKENNQIQELNHSYDLKINSLKSELLEVNMSNMYNDDETQADEAKKQLDILSREKEELLEQNNKLLADISAKEKEKGALSNENEIKISSLQSMIAENESSLRTKKEMNVKLQDIIDDLEKKYSEKEESIFNFNLKMDELGQSKEFIEKEAKMKIAKCEDKVKWLENKLNDKRKVLASTSESHKVITKKYAALKTEKAYLIKEVRNVSALQIKNKSLEEQLVNVSALQIKNKSLEEQLLKAREENGDEPGLIIDDKVVYDEPSTSTSAKPSSPAKIPVSGRSLSRRDPRRKSAEARHMNLSSNESISSKEMDEQLTTMSGEPSKSLKELPKTHVYTPKIHNSDISSNSGQHQEDIMPQRMKIDYFKPPLPFYSIFDIKTPPPPPPPPFSQLTAASTIPLPNSIDAPKSYVSEDMNVPPPMPSSNSLTSHLNPGLSQLSTWMTKNTVKNLSEYRPLSTSSVPQNEPSLTSSNNFYSTQNVVDYYSQSRSEWPQKRSRSRSRERDVEERYESRTREDDMYHQRGSIYRDREQSDNIRRNDRRYYDRSYDYYYRKERRNSGENSPRGKKWKTEEQKFNENANWNVVPNKYLNL